MPMQDQPSTAMLEPLLRKLEYRQALDAEDRRAILAMRHQTRDFEAHQLIVREGDRPEYSCVLLAGFAMRQKIGGEGQRAILAIHMKGEAVDLQNSLLGFADYSVQMLTRGSIAMIPREDVIRVAAERPAVGRAMWIDTLVDGSIFREWIMNVGRRDAKARLAHLLCEFALRLEAAGLGEQTDYELPMTQEQLADAIGLTPIHVNRTIKLLEASNLIRRSSARRVHISDWRALAKVGDFDPAYLHMAQFDENAPVQPNWRFAH
jgi:CRP-like cAMP-binding protein